MPYPYTLAAALVLASIYLFGGKLRARPRHRAWISMAGGVSVATVFVDMLPEISERQAKFAANAHGTTALFPEQAIYLCAMLGFVLFYGLQYMVASSLSPDGQPSRFSCSLRIVAFAGYSSLIAYLLVHSIWPGVPSLILYAVAMAFHLLLIDHSLADGNVGTGQGWGRFSLALAIMLGWSAGMLTAIPEQWLARITGFVSGAVIMNFLVVELPEGRGGSFWPFVLAAAGYTFVLIVVLG